MKVRAKVVGAAAGVAAALLFTSAGAAAQPTRAGEKAEAPALAAPGLPAAPAREMIDVQAIVAGPRLLGDAWLKVLTATLDAMKRAAELERVAATGTLAPLTSRPRPAAWPSPPAGDEPRAQPTPPLVVRPVPFVPPTRAASDVRGEQAVLLGAVARLPWMVP